jgi:hypothetical protein
MKKIRVFLSSRVHSGFVGLNKDFTLTDLRQYLRENLEAEELLEEEVFEVITNETSFEGDFSKNSFDNCMDTMRSCDIIIVLYNKEAGWFPENLDVNGICHEEFLIAVNEFSGMTWAMDLSSYFELPEEGIEKAKNDAFISDFELYSRHREEISGLDTVEGLKAKILKQTKSYLLTAIEKSIATRKEEVMAANDFGSTLDWSKLTYHERQSEMISLLELTYKSIPAFEKTIKAYHAIPDNMSVADARNLIGRPFIEEHELIKDREEDSGVIHFVAVYGSATELQVKNLVGYPDLVVIKGSFGFYLWEKNRHIQMFFLTKCINHQTIRRRLSQLTNWLRISREQLKIVRRAMARYSILNAINMAEQMEGLK